jgi:hypothetical protein
MKLEVGKYYLRSDGEKVGPAEWRPDDSYTNGGYWAVAGWHYNEYGRHIYGYDSKHLVSEIPSGIKLEEGKYYLTRVGEKVGPMEKLWPNMNHPWGFTEGKGSYSYCYKEDGMRYRSGNSCNSDADDLVLEWKEATSMDIKVGDLVNHMSYRDTTFKVVAIHNKHAWVVAEVDSSLRTVYLENLKKPAPKPVVTEVELFGHVVGVKYFTSSSTEHHFDTHKITLNLVDGVVDVTSIKMEKL